MSSSTLNSMSRTKTALFIILLLALVLRVAFIIFYDNGKMLKNVSYAADEASYDQIAVNFLSGKGLVTDEGLYARRAPVYPFFLALCYSVFGHSYVSVRFLQALLGVLTCLIVYLIGKQIFDTKTGVFAAGICAVYYPFIVQPGYLLTEVLFTFLLAVVIFYLNRAALNGFSLKSLFIAALVFGISTLCRDSLLIFGILLFPLFLLNKRIGLRKKIFRFIFFLFFLSLVIFPWSLRNYRIYHALIPVSLGGGHTLYLGNNSLTPGGTGGEWTLEKDSFFPHDVKNLFSVEADRELKKRALVFIKSCPKRFLELGFRKFINMWRPYYASARTINKIIMTCSYVPLIILSIIGIVLSIKFWQKAFVLYALLFYFTFIHMITIAEIRYRYPVMPYLIIFAAFFLSKLVSTCLKRS